VQESHHVAVFRKGHVWKVDVSDAQNNPLPAENLVAALDSIIADNSPAPSHPIGLLTTLDRDSWFVLHPSLDDSTHPHSYRATARAELDKTSPEAMKYVGVGFVEASLAHPP
jgi:hypothetical protein